MLDVISMDITWGLELGDTTQTIIWVVESLFESGLLLLLDHILEWAMPSLEQYTL